MSKGLEENIEEQKNWEKKQRSRIAKVEVKPMN